MFKARGITSLWLAPLMVAACAGQVEAGEARLTLDETVAAGANVVVQTHWADVKVAPGASDKVQVRAELSMEASGDNAEVQKLLEEQKIVIERQGNTVIVKQEKPKARMGGRGRTRGQVTVSVPAGMPVAVSSGSGGLSFSGDLGAADLVADTGSGDIALKGGFVADEVKASTGSGDVAMEGAARTLKIDAASGDVQIKAARPLELLSVDCASGSVSLEGGAARVDVDSASGDIKLAGLMGATEVNSASGDVDLDFTRIDAGARIEANSASGDVRLTVPSGLELGGTLETFSGRVKINGGPLQTSDSRSITLRGAHAQLEIGAVSGDVVLEYR